MEATAGRRGRWLALTLALTGLFVLALALVDGATRAAHASSQRPPGPPGTREVLVVGNNWDGTVDFVDPRTFRRLRRVNAVPDFDERLAEVQSDPIRYGFFLGIREFVGEGHDQLVDDAFTSNDGRLLFISRPSFADVIALDLVTRRIAWRFKVDGIRSDHMAISPDGKQLAVSAITASKVQILDTQTGALLTHFESGDQPHENNYSKDGRKIFHASIGQVFTPFDQRAIDQTKGDRWFQVVDAKTMKILQRVDMGQKMEEAGYPGVSSAVRPMAIDPTERYAYVQLSFFHGFAEYDMVEQKVTRVARLPQTASKGLAREQYLLDSAHHGLSMSGDGEKLCVAGTMDDYAAIVDRDDFDYTLIEVGSKPYWSTNSADGRYCFVSVSGDDRVAVIDYETEKQIAAIPVGFHPQRSRIGSVIASAIGVAPDPPPALGLSLSRRVLRAGGARPGRRFSVPLRAARRATELRASLRRGGRNYATGTLEEIEDRRSLRLRVRRRLRGGAYRLRLRGLDDFRRPASRSFRVRVR